MALSEALISDAEVAAFIDLAASANVHFDLYDDRLTMRMVNPNWRIWSPCRHLLDEIGVERIEVFLRHRAAEQEVVGRWTHASAERLHVAAEAMR